MIPQKLQSLGLTNLNSYTMWRNEFIYIQDGKYYPTITMGYTNAAVCPSLESAKQWINNNKDNKNNG